MTQQQLADAVDTHVTHLSRLETGKRAPASRELLTRLSDVLGSGSLLASASGRLPSHVEAAIAALPAAVGEAVFEYRTLPVLRRLASGEAAVKMLSCAPGGAIDGAGRVDPGTICRSLGFEPVLRHGIESTAVRFEERRVVVCEPASPSSQVHMPRIRFLLAHAAAHISRDESVCRFPRLDAHEEAAISIACHLLCPPDILRSTFRTVTSGLSKNEDYLDLTQSDMLWSPVAGRVVAGVASRLAVPGWVVMRRLVDEALFDEEALHYLDGVVL
ncbi:hypothetical protein RERY_43060 [Rhodococcus erythropolis]|jgi:transcriptional regulator with XRE-family HTH domain|nr:hypothetical protein RERY_43060 [Rhodococcus erythropolis]